MNAKQIANGQHPNKLLAIDYRQVPAANLFHALEGLMGGFVALDDSPDWACHLAKLQVRRIAAGNYHTIQQVALREDADQFSFCVEHAHRANLSLRHEVRRVKYALRRAQRIRLAVTDDISNEHRSALLIRV
ncbi:MAG TPA: hypothetical protein VF751_03295 [Chthoniobacterales bacterium]